MKLNAKKCFKVWAILCGIVSIIQILYGFYWLDCIVGAILAPGMGLIVAKIGSIDEDDVSSYLSKEKELCQLLTLKYSAAILLQSIFGINTAVFYPYSAVCAIIQILLYVFMTSFLFLGLMHDIKKIRTAKKQLKKENKQCIASF